MTTLPVSADGQAIALACTALATAGDRSLKPLSPTQWSGLASNLESAGMQPRDLIGLDRGEIASRLRLDAEPAERLADLMSRGGQLGLELERLAGLGIWIVTVADDSYPETLVGRLGRTAPPVMFGAGPRGGLAAAAIAVVGSRDVDERGLEFTAELARTCVRQDFAIASGAARGVDTAAMVSAVESGGRAIGITVDPLERLIRRGDLRAAIAEEQMTLVTPFLPNARWHASNAMRRNRLIYAISQAAVVVASSAEKGGTRAGAVENLKAGWVPLHVRDDGTPGTRRLISEGAEPLGEDLGGLLVDALARPRQHVLAVAPPEPSSATPETAFELIWEFLAARLEHPLTEKEVASVLDVTQTQSRAWLHRAVAEGLVEVVSEKPKRYSLAGGRNGAQQMHLEA